MEELGFSKNAKGQRYYEFKKTLPQTPASYQTGESGAEQAPND